ncbi:MAG: hypothetical protein P1P93_02085 [Gammaproteobacteria bacterium]|nr:hypothetical protein [Gammaproteobacteria bacterium]
MITRTRTFTSFAVLAALGVFLPMSNSHAFGLGKIELSSALNQPFKAQIPVTALREDEKGNLQVQLASASEFERAGLERSFYLTQFEFIVVENNGTTSIDIRSKDAVKEPFIDLLLTATAGNGRLIREYTVLLDPPKDIFVKKQTKIQTVASKPTQTATPISSKSTKYSAGSSYGPTDRSDTLWKIALKVKQDDATVHQMMMALLDENPEAFSNNNINGLKAGYNLDIPAETSIKKRSKSEAISAVAQQNTAWKNRNAKPIVTTTVEVTTSPTESPAVQAATEQVTMPVKNDELVESATDTTARLKLVAPSEEVVSNESEISPMGDDKLTALTEQLTLAQETIETQTQENIDIKSRMAAMEEQIETLRRLLSLKDPDLALLQSTLEQQTEVAESQDETVQTDATDSSASNDLEENDQETVADDTSSADSESQEYISDQLSQTDTLVDNVEPIQTHVQESEQVNTEIEQALNSVDGAMSYVSDLTGLDQEQVKSKYEQVKAYVTEHKQTVILGSLVLLLLIWLIIRMRNRPYVSWDQAVKDTSAKASMTTETDRTPAVDNDDVVATEVTSVAEDVPEKTPEQLVNDADVYVSYGDFVKAKQNLESAHDAEPMNEEVIHKLLFVLYKQSQINEFAQLAEYYRNQTNAPEWDQVVSWGQELAPQEALFQSIHEETVEETLPEVPSSQVVDTIELDEKNPDLDITSSNADIDDELMAFDFNQNSSDDEVALDLTDELGVSNVSQDDDRLSLPEVESLELDRVDTIETDLDTTSNASTSDTMEFELDLNNDDETFELDDLEVVTDDDLTQANAALSGSELDFDLGEFDQVDEAETKLDLAAAYIDMGDPDGARSILEEVLLEGNDDQKTRAETMLSDIK